MTALGLGLPFPNGGSKLSGAGPSPCPESAADGGDGAAAAIGAEAPPRAEAPIGRAPDGPASDLLRYTRMVKPFSTRRLSDALYHVQADGNVLGGLLIRAQIEQPTTADRWVETLEAILDILWSLGQRCEDASAALEQMIDEADVQAERGEAAIRAIIAGLRAG